MTSPVPPPRSVSTTRAALCRVTCRIIADVHNKRRAAAVEAALRRGVDLQSVNAEHNRLCRRFAGVALFAAPSGALTRTVRTHAYLPSRGPAAGHPLPLATLREHGWRHAAGLRRGIVSHRWLRLLSCAAAHHVTRRALGVPQMGAHSQVPDAYLLVGRLSKTPLIAPIFPGSTP